MNYLVEKDRKFIIDTLTNGKPSPCTETTPPEKKQTLQQPARPPSDLSPPFQLETVLVTRCCLVALCWPWRSLNWRWLAVFVVQRPGSIGLCASSLSGRVKGALEGLEGRTQELSGRQCSSTTVPLQ